MSEASILTPVLPRTKSDLRMAMSFVSREIAAALACGQIGTIATYYPEEQTADINLVSSIVVGYETGQNGQIAPITKSYPTLPKVPLMILGGGSAFLSFPIATGDTVVLLFMDRDISSWMTSGQIGQPPNSNRLHDLSDAIGIVGIQPLSKPRTGISATDALLWFNATTRINVGPAGIVITDGPATITLNTATGAITIQNGAANVVVSPGLVELAIGNAKVATDGGLLTVQGAAGVTAGTATTTLITALFNWVNSDGTTPDEPTRTALSAALAQFAEIYA